MSASNIHKPFLAALYKSAEIGSSLNISKFVAIYIAEIIFGKEWKELEDREALIIKRYCKHSDSYNKLKGYTREALYSLIETTWDLTNPIELIPETAKWAIDYNAATSEISLEKFLAKRETFPKKEFAQCGTTLYVETPLKEDRRKSNVQSSASSNPITDKMLKLYNKLVEARTIDTQFKDFEYIWQWLITPSEYSEIKELLQSTDKKQINKAIKNNIHCKKLLVIYIAEHFKREYNGRDEGQNILDSLGFGTDDYKSLISQDSCKVYQSKEQKRWKASIQIEGGLPIRYITDNQTSNLANFAEDIYNDEQKAINSLNNSTLRESYKSQHSIYKFIKALKENEPICSTEDKESEDYRELYRLLEEGRKKSVPSKFYIQYAIWKSRTQFSIKRTLMMRECNAYGESPAYVISNKRLEKWKVSNSPYTFWLMIATNGWCKYHQFVPHGASAEGVLYRSHIRQDRFELPKIYVDDGAQPVTISLLEHRGDESIEVENIPFLKDGYKQFHQINDFEWREGKGDGEQRCAVLYNTEEWCIESESDSDVSVIAKTYRWLEFETTIKLSKIGSNKTVTLISSTSGIVVEPTEESIHPIAKLSYVDVNGGVISLEKLDDSDTINRVYLLRAGTHVTFQITHHKDEDMMVKSDVKSVEIDPEYRGYRVIKVDTENGFSKKIHCYFLPNDANIRRHEEEDKGSIFFDNLQVKSVTRGLFSDTIYTFSDTINSRTLYLACSYAEFSIMDELYRFSIRVVRPFIRRDRFRGNQIDLLGNAIPIRYSGRYRVRVMDNNGVHTLGIDKSSKSQMMDHLYSGLKSGKDGEEKVINGLTYCIYTNNHIQYHTRERFYYVDNGRSVDSSNLIFKFLSLTDNSLTDIALKTIELTEQGRRTQYLTLDFNPTTDGIVVQSIYDNKMERIEPFRCYRPCFVSAKPGSIDTAQRRKVRIKRLCQYTKESESLINEATFRHFEVVHECGCYFGAMDRLMALLHTPSCLTTKGKCEVGHKDPPKCKLRSQCSTWARNKEYRLAAFYVGYAKYCKNNRKQPYYDGLCRMADEFRFDWIAIKREVWNSVCTENGDKDIVTNLFKKLYPYYEALINNYWDVTWKATRGLPKELKNAKELLDYILNPDTKTKEAPMFEHQIRGINIIIEQLIN